MERRARCGITGLLVGLGLGLVTVSNAQAGAMYAVKDLGIAPDLTNAAHNVGKNGPYPAANVAGNELLKVDALGAVTTTPSIVRPPANSTDPTDRPVAGLGPLYNSTGLSDNGHYQAGSVRSYVGYGLNMANAFVSRDGQAVSLGRPDSAGGFSQAFGVNNTGQVVGTMGDQSSKAFLYTQGLGKVDLGTLGGPSSWAFGINNLGKVVGLSTVSGQGIYEELSHAFLFDGHVMLDLNDLVPPDSGFLLTSATSINDLGQIAGYALDHDNYFHQVLLTPQTTPEPGALALLGVGMTVLAARRFRANRR